MPSDGILYTIIIIEYESAYNPTIGIITSKSGVILYAIN